MEYLQNTRNIRNILILAHVDHGKTTIADSLIASNGIISKRMAGKARYMDDRTDEQERGITMKSSSISLKHSINDERYLINLIDSPGHVDFCGEVSAAVRLCDGALIVIDVVEGVCPQTKTALEQAWNEGIKPILVFNKIDRLIVEQMLDETAAHLRLSQLLEQVNAIVATLLTTQLFTDQEEQESKKEPIVENISSQSEVSDGHVYDWASAIDDIDDDKYYFMPEKGNVVFASAIDDWAFTINTFVEIINAKLNINKNALQKTLFGDYYIDTKQKRILKNAQAKLRKTLFVSLILRYIWKIYGSVMAQTNTIFLGEDKDSLTNISKKLNITVTPRDINHSDNRHKLRHVMSNWLPLSRHVLDCVVKLVPSPQQLSEKRVERLLSSNFKKFHQLTSETQSLKKDFMQCSSSDDAPKVAYISKISPFERKTKGGTESEIILIAFARIFSGKLCVGDKLFVLGPKHDPSKITDVTTIDPRKKLEDLDVDEHVTVAEMKKLYILMGRDIEEITYANAGNVIGIGGLESHLLRTATISDKIYCHPFNDLHLPASPILRVAIEPQDPKEMQYLINGLKLLNQADPCVEVKLQQTGEHVIIATGEVHLQKCVEDLEQRYAKIGLNVSSPIVPFRETIVLPPKIDMVNEAIDDTNLETSALRKLTRKTPIELFTPNRKCCVKIKASPLPDKVLKLLLDSVELLRFIARILTSHHRSTLYEQMTDINIKKVEEFKSKLTEAFKSSVIDNSDLSNLYSDDIVNRIWSFGPKYSGPNLLVIDSSLDLQFNIWNKLKNDHTSGSLELEVDDLKSYEDSFVSGFQLATQAGPLCEEPMMGVCFTVHEWASTMKDQVNPEANGEGDNEGDDNSSSKSEDQQKIGNHNSRDYFGPMSGQIISTVKDCCRKGFQDEPQRLMSPMYSCTIHVTTEMLGKMYAVLGRRHGRILSSDMKEGSQTFEIMAVLPVIESLDFVNEIRKQTSGMANPQLLFSHWELIDVDPFWTPSTEEEYSLFGEKADTENQAKKYMNLVRKRKGLALQEKIVEHAEKQRTIKKNK